MLKSYALMTKLWEMVYIVDRQNKYKKHHVKMC